MADPRTQLEHMLAALDESVPRLLRERPDPADFWADFMAKADAIQQHAMTDEHAWVCDRLDAIQVKHQLVPPADQI